MVRKPVPEIAVVAAHILFWTWPRILQLFFYAGSPGWAISHIRIFDARSHLPASFGQRAGWMIVRSVHYLIFLALILWPEDIPLFMVPGVFGYMAAILLGLTLTTPMNHRTWYDRIAGVELVHCPLPKHAVKTPIRGFEVVTPQRVIPIDDSTTDSLSRKTKGIEGYEHPG